MSELYFFKRHPEAVHRVWETDDGEYITVTTSPAAARLLIMAYFQAMGWDFDTDEFQDTYTSTEITIRPDYMHCDEGDYMTWTCPGGAKALLWAEK